MRRTATPYPTYKHRRRLARFEQLVGRGVPETEALQRVAAEFRVSRTTIRRNVRRGH